MIKKVKAVPIVAAMLWGVGTQAQELSSSVINTAGGSRIVSGDTYEYSIGEMVLVHTFSGPNLIVTQGLLQPAEADSDVSIRALTLTDGELSVYPNPSSDVIHIQPNLSSGGKLEIALTDITGRWLSGRAEYLKAGNEKQQISLQPFSSGSYMLHITFTLDGKSYMRNFKIQKIN